MSTFHTVRYNGRRALAQCLGYHCRIGFLLISYNALCMFLMICNIYLLYELIIYIILSNAHEGHQLIHERFMHCDSTCGSHDKGFHHISQALQWQFVFPSTFQWLLPSHCTSGLQDCSSTLTLDGWYAKHLSTGWYAMTLVTLTSVAMSQTSAALVNFARDTKLCHTGRLIGHRNFRCLIHIMLASADLTYQHIAHALIVEQEHGSLENRHDFLLAVWLSLHTTLVHHPKSLCTED